MLESFFGWCRAQNSLDRSLGAERFAADQAKEKILRGFLTSESDGREQNRAPPRIPGSVEVLPQGSECFEGMRSGYGKGGLGGHLVGGFEKAAYPRDRDRAFHPQNARITSSENFRLVRTEDSS